ncbi:MAG: prepilin-type N-terminal cleavage/methylation domain-containing protein [Gammaproteobacteria bacterium]|nr:prepilin-type N-terminal cleavage/methylation domain-containing protein [Gammaproteobacteria bacterium]
MAPKVERSLGISAGFTLLELLLVLSVIGILSSIAVWGGQKAKHGWRLKRAGHQLFEDLKAIQSDAEMSGSLTINNGRLNTQRRFMVFDLDTNSYEAYRWRDDNGNGVVEDEETAMQWRHLLPSKIAFAWSSGVDRRACSNVNNPPGTAVSFSSPDYPPCNDQPCIKFDHNGFSVMGPGAIYLSDERHSLAITATRTGHFTMCEWTGEKWK